ncbi:probable disease resistance protein At1g15890 [Prosopis cineraria]|uniref:probable disease resistance protein At1g15890 n=1 Tax=Prosopis cineraria TaxID=364024 RepID=UPI00240F86CB|nr:probable disease resistance protein At1g15890 [Prosopis cineraria]
MGGTGKTTMAKEVGQQVESKPFDKVIFTNVSTPVDEKRIRDDVVKQLGLQLEEEKKLTHAQQIWTKIANAGRVLIILDDVWEKLNLESIGIQPGFHRTGTCNILLTTRNENVCTQMGCQKRKIIHLDALPEKDALNLFLFHAIEIGQDCPDDLKKVALDIVNECGRLPVIIVVAAKTLKDWLVKKWQDSLTALRNTEPSRHEIVDEVEMRFYNSLKLSYTSLKDRKAQVLFLLCSIFPKAYEIPIELLSKNSISVGLFGEFDKYNIARSQVNVVNNKLINSSLLLKADEECVKMHDVIREVALEIANEKVQVLMDFKPKLKEYEIFILDHKRLL